MSANSFLDLGQNRYVRTVELLKKVTTGKFTTKQGYNLSRPDLWSPAMKKQVRRYWAEYAHLTSRPHETYRSKDAKKLRSVQRASLQQKFYGKFNVAFIPVSGNAKPEVKFTKQGVVIKEGAISRRVLKINHKNFALDTDAEINRLVAKAPGAKFFRIQCGNFEYYKGNYDTAEFLIRAIKRFQMTYDNYGQWLVGIVAYYFDDRKDYRDFSQVVNRERDKRKKVNKKRAQQRYYYLQRLKLVNYSIQKEQRLSPRNRLQSTLDKLLSEQKRIQDIIDNL